MEENTKAKVFGLASKISRTAAVFLGLFFLILFVLAIVKSVNAPSLSANVLLTTPDTKSAASLKKALEKRAIVKLTRYFQHTPGADEFLQDVTEWNTVSEVRVETVESGIFVTVLASKTGDSLHTYFGFFRKENRNINEIIWSGITTGKLGSETISPDGTYRMTSVANIGKIPWLADDDWENARNGSTIILLVPEDADAILPGGSGTFVYQGTEKSLTPENVTRGFLVKLE